MDITDALVTLFNPDEQTRKMSGELRKRQPEPIEAIAKVPVKN